MSYCVCGHPEEAHLFGGRCRVPECTCDRFWPIPEIAAQMWSRLMRTRADLATRGDGNHKRISSVGHASAKRGDRELTNSEIGPAIAAQAPLTPDRRALARRLCACACVRLVRLPVDGSLTRCDETGSIAANVWYVPGSALVCGLGAMSAGVVMTLTLGQSYEQASQIMHGGCSGPWVLQPSDLRQPVP